MCIECVWWGFIVALKFEGKTSINFIGNFAIATQQGFNDNNQFKLKHINLIDC